MNFCFKFCYVNGAQGGFLYTSKTVFVTHSELTMPAQYMSETLFWSLLNVAQIHPICVKLCQISLKHDQLVT